MQRARNVRRNVCRREEDRRVWRRAVRRAELTLSLSVERVLSPLHTHVGLPVSRVIPDGLDRNDPVVTCVERRVGDEAVD